MAEKIDPELLISLVESRPGLWDKSSDSHRDYVMRSTAWKDICRVLNPEYNNLTRRDRSDYVKIVMKKWTNIRDAWKKSVAEDKKKLRPYIYHEQLKFLQKNLLYKKNESIDGDASINKTEEDSDDASDSLASVYQKSARKRKIQEQEEEANMIQFMDVKHVNSEDAHISFIRGLLPSLSKLDDDETLEFQMGVIKLLQEIRRRGRPENESFPYYNMPTSSYDMTDIKKSI